MVNPGTSMSADEVMKSIVRARRATRYDAINYLVPDFREVSDKNNAAPLVQRIGPAPGGYAYKLFAPLLGPNLLYKTSNDVESVVTTYMKANDPAIDAYLSSLLEVANSIYNMPSQGDTKGAALSIHANAGTSNSRPDPLLIGAPASDPGCKSDMASKFNHFFREKETGCELVPLKKMMIQYIAKKSVIQNGIDNGSFYIGLYYDEPNSNLIRKTTPEELMTAYFPGVRQGTDQAGVAHHPLGAAAASYSTRRNYYSTKFFQMAKVIDAPPMTNNSTHGRRDYQEQPALRESESEAPADLVGKIELKNPLKYDDATGINNIYYLDF